MTTADDPLDDELGTSIGRAVRELPDVPPALRRAAIDLWSAAPLGAPGSWIAGAWRHVVAVLDFDSWAAPALATGMRSQRAPVRHLLYSAEGRDIDLRVAPGAEPGCVLTGQILGPDGSGAIELERLGGVVQPARTARLDELGEFRIEGVDSGVYRMTLAVGNDRIVLPPLDVGDRPG
jgi:hypothetical protein